MVPYGPDCRSSDGTCDCSSFALWCLGIRQFQDQELWWLKELNGGWYNTDGVWYDAQGSGGHLRAGFTGNFVVMSKARVGCVIVYPAKWVSRVPGPKVGHIGIITNVQATECTVIHCSKGNYENYRDSIYETKTDVFDQRQATIYAWAASVRPEVT